MVMDIWIRRERVMVSILKDEMRKKREIKYTRKMAERDDGGKDDRADRQIIKSKLEDSLQSNPRDCYQNKHVIFDFLISATSFLTW